VALAPFSLPVMQMGFEAYLRLIYERPDLLARLMQINEEFCVAWASAQVAAGANAICYFDPVSSSTIVSPELYRATGYAVARRVLPRIPAPVAMHFASGACLPILPDVQQTGAALVGVSSLEDLGALKAACRGKIGLFGNLNGITMARWSAAEAEAEVKHCLAAAATGGGYILADNHGEIPWQVSDEVLLAIADAVRRWGAYPLQFAELRCGLRFTSWLPRISPSRQQPRRRRWSRWSSMPTRCTTAAQPPPPAEVAAWCAGIPARRAGGHHRRQLSWPGCRQPCRTGGVRPSTGSTIPSSC
jgi:hypothetical protein